MAGFIVRSRSHYAIIAHIEPLLYSSVAPDNIHRLFIVGGELYGFNDQGIQKYIVDIAKSSCNFPCDLSFQGQLTKIDLNT